MNQQINKQEEWLPIMDESGAIIDKAPRSVCHSGSKLLHPVVHMHICNEQGEIFLQKRSMQKKLLPGKWDTAVGGHISFGESIEEALKRETWEELGISDFESQPIGRYIWESERERELVFSFLCYRYDQIKIGNEEVDEGRFWSRLEIENGITEGIVTPNFAHEYKQLLSKLC
jgi:isopentenyldiphosphate isomerase